MKNENKCRDIEILVVEDNYADIRLIQEYFKDERMINHKLHVVSDGLEAISFLRKEGSYSDSPTPNLILLDLFLPKLDGKEVLRKIRSDKRFSELLVCLMTSSVSEEETLNSEKQNAVFFILKPVNVDKFFNLLKKAEVYLPLDLRVLYLKAL